MRPPRSFPESGSDIVHERFSGRDFLLIPM
jgi:hypothetical protein